MTKVFCDITSCKYNNSCCSSPSDKKEKECYCTREYIKFSVDDAMCSTECKHFEEDTEKEIECRHCQIDKYGGIKLRKPIEFEECDIEEFKF